MSAALGKLSRNGSLAQKRDQEHHDERIRGRFIPKQSQDPRAATTTGTARQKADRAEPQEKRVVHLRDPEMRQSHYTPRLLGRLPGEPPCESICRCALRSLPW